MIAAAGLSVLNLAAIAAVLIINLDGDLASRLAVLVIPTTVAATFVLVREQTALATRLQARPRLILAATAVALWLVVCGRIILDGDSTRDPAHRPNNPSPLLIGER
jgi:hypothetical protein